MAKKRLKIAFLSFFNGIYERGVEVLVKELASRINQSCDVTVFQAGKSSNKTKYKVIQIENNWQPKILEPKLNLGRRLYLDEMSIAVKEFTKKALPILKKQKYDIVVPWNNGWEILLPKLSGVGKIIVVGQAGPGWDDRINLLTFPDCFVGFTDYQCNWAKKVNPFVKIVKIPNGVDMKKFSSQGEKMEFNLPKPIILTVAALVPMKRLDLIIKAVADLRKGSLILAGKGELKNDLQDLGDKLLPGRFKILLLPHEEIPKIYRSVALFTFPTSPWESFGLVLLEAMASGLPVVATDDPIRREIIGDAGVFVDTTRPNLYAKALEETLQINWGDKPRKQTEKFSWDKVAKQYENLFEELVS